MRYIMNSIIYDGRCFLPGSLKRNFPKCYYKILNLKLQGDNDTILQNGLNKITSHNIISMMFKDLLKVNQLRGIWFKGLALNYSLYCLLAIKGLKTYENFYNKGLGPCLIAFFVACPMILMLIFFYACTFSMAC